MAPSIDSTIRTLSLDSRPGRGRGPTSDLPWQDLAIAVTPTARAGRTWEPPSPRGTFEPRPSSCTGAVHGPPCAVEIYFARPWRRAPANSGWTPPANIGPTFDQLAPVRADLAAACTRLLAAVDSGRAPTGPMSQPHYQGRPGARPVVVTPPVALPAIPELVEGADAAARRATIDRVAPLLREVAAVLETAPPDVAARARAALVRLAK